MRVRRLRRALVLAILVVATACARTNPQIRISAERVPRHWQLEVQGAGFTPNQNISSHLLRSADREFPVLPILTDSRGEFTHTIDTMILELGPHELWVVDDASGKTSNRVRFEVTYDYPKGNSGS